MCMENLVGAWEDEGGSSAPTAPAVLTGTHNQIAWAEQIRTRVDAEFERVRISLTSVAMRQSGQSRADTLVMIAILDDKHVAVMANSHAGYFIYNWQDVPGQVRELILGDPRYQTIKFRPVTPE